MRHGEEVTTVCGGVRDLEVSDPVRPDTAYREERGRFTDIDPAGMTTTPSLCSLGGGLVSTVGDYARVLDELARPTTVTERSAREVTTDPSDRPSAGGGRRLPLPRLRLPRLRRPCRLVAHGRSRLVRLERRPRLHGLHDPTRDLTAVLLTNRTMDDPSGSVAFPAFLDAVSAL